MIAGACPVAESPGGPGPAALDGRLRRGGGRLVALGATALGPPARRCRPCRRPRRPFLAVAAALVALLVSACGGGGTPAALVEVPRTTPSATSTTPPASPSPASTAATDPAATGGAVVAPLTGEPVADLALMSSPAVGVKVDNAPRGRPQQGLERADVVFEELVEGGLTRFLAVFHSREVGTVGPVRSGRDVDADLFPPFDGVLAIAGAAPETYGVLFGAGLTLYEEDQAGGAIRRAPGRPPPHNLVADVASLRTVSDQPAAEPQWAFRAEPPPGGTPTADAVLQFTVGSRDDVEAAWAWRSERGVWERGQEGTRHRTLSGDQVAAENVVIVRVEVGSGGGVDVTGSATVSMDLVGEGPAVILRNGQRYDGTWSKEGREAPFRWLRPDGEELPLAPGRTWVELLPTGGSVAFDRGATSADGPEPPPLVTG